MPLGKHYMEEGRLLREGSKLILLLDGGGRWRLASDKDLEPLLGLRVRLEGTRSGFDRLDVARVEKC